MSRGKIIVIEGTDCSGKETQSKLLIDKLVKNGKDTVYYSFPAYNTSTGKIVGLSYLGKPYLAKELIDEKRDNIINELKNDDDFNQEYVDKVLDKVIDSLSCGWFKEGAPNVDPKISSLYYAADRAYSLSTINDYLDKGINVILDRYVYSNMAHQGGKIHLKKNRKEMYDWLSSLEFGMMGLPKPDLRIFLHMPTDYTTLLKQKREEKLDEHERDLKHLKNAEKAYLEIADFFDFKTFNCIKDDSSNVEIKNIKSIGDINLELYNYVNDRL